MRRLIFAALAIEVGCLALTFAVPAAGGYSVALFLAVMGGMGVVYLWTARGLCALPGGGREPAFILGAAAVFALTLLPGEPLFDDDVWRYLWDGKVTLSETNPYRHSPDDPQLAGLRDGGWERIGYRTLPTPYPPAAQLLFAGVRLVTGGGLPGWKVTAVFWFMASGLLLLGLMRASAVDGRWVLLWAWNPLVLKEFCNSAHLDVAAVALVLGALALFLRNREGMAGGLLAAAVLTKVFPLFLAPAMMFRARRPGRFLAAFILAGAALAAPFLGVGGRIAGSLGTYTRYWLFNHGAFELWQRLWELPLGAGGSLAARLSYWLLAALAALLLGWLWRRTAPAGWIARQGWFLMALVACSPAVMPWYLAWGLPLAALGSSRAPFVFSVLASGSYAFYAGHVDLPWLRWTIHASAAAALAWEWRRRAGQRKPPAPGSTRDGGRGNGLPIPGPAGTGR